MTPSTSPRCEIGVCVFFILGCLAVLWETRDIPAGTFEPLGSAPVPQATAVLVMLLSLAVAVTAARRLMRDGAVALTDDVAPRPFDAAMVAVATVVYVALLDARVLDFAPLTAIFLFLVITFLARFDRRQLLAAAMVAVTTGWGCAYIFTRIFVVDLPGL